MVGQARFTAFTLINRRAARREAFLSRLSHRFTSVSKAQLRQSDMVSVLLDSDSVDKPIGQEQQVAEVLCNEPEAKALIKSKPRQDIPLVEKHLCPGSTVGFCGPQDEGEILSGHRPLLPQQPCLHYKVPDGNVRDGAGSCPPAQLDGVGRP